MRRDIRHRTHDRPLGRRAEELAGAYEKIGELSRRRFLKLGAAAGGLLAGGMLTPGTARADQAVKTGQFVFPRLQFAVYDESVDRWNVHPVGDVILKKKLAELTNINVSQEQKVVRLADFDDMVRHPFVFMTSEGFFRLAPEEERNLREFLERGGFIMSDDCVIGTTGDRFFQCYCKLINKLFPENPMRKIPYDHEVFHVYFDFPNGAPHMQGVNHGAYGAFERGTGRLMTIATPGDIHCGWCCRYWGMDRNMAAIKFGINEIIFFLSH
jgi:hypothetical protein